MDELASGGEVFLSSRELVRRLGENASNLFVLLYDGGYVLFIVSLVLFPNVGGKGSHNGRI